MSLTTDCCHRAWCEVYGTPHNGFGQAFVGLVCSTNGTFVNDERVLKHQPVTLHDGDVVWRCRLLNIAIRFASSSVHSLIVTLRTPHAPAWGGRALHKCCRSESAVKRTCNFVFAWAPNRQFHPWTMTTPFTQWAWAACRPETKIPPGESARGCAVSSTCPTTKGLTAEQ